MGAVFCTLDRVSFILRVFSCFSFRWYFVVWVVECALGVTFSGLAFNATWVGALVRWLLFYAGFRVTLVIT